MSVNYSTMIGLGWIVEQNKMNEMLARVADTDRRNEIYERFFTCIDSYYLEGSYLFGQRLWALDPSEVIGISTVCEKYTDVVEFEKTFHTILVEDMGYDLNASDEWAFPDYQICAMVN